ncbi:C4-dicarboxylate transporter DctA [Paraburkholderia sp. RL17-368-BIF-A]|jgi:DAACS family dicarboxylate/amino acid:cation (Na+ or H+) symporter/aerobic C4-dicarboxylate transport protein|uniref:Aerobic C4-dicarboxylate transport protein n=1 Tax=Paraburkholderia graminis TaxID=60548 RepID=A0ABD5CQF2_9BURK|nr:C4-dicarboxylate transporter DctA [Paraburkholderia graminis]ALE57226.1 C4-dicarboxylate transporter [Burkholderia sp. HB1]MDQ0624967.1 aerobic C4-dicarboxylate transport protein [Paraburkholderia graminis]MDR6206122.1 aerobic C4-dicarboxylate transport protein [Paraburkholderia graminis]MDR6470318.1 DAACS family dicarboxylate/amino acid:cation (Na+ or H+) symporter/aerobic C4-dicarboxylate transport protein [Paraburkholderia graminis]
MLVSKGRKIVSKLYVQVLIGIVAGILVGHFYPDIGSQLKPLGDLFIKLIRMLLAPIIFASVVVGIARMNDLHEAGRVGVKAVVYFEVASTIALLIGMVVVNVIKPGSGMNVDPSHIDGAAIATYTHAAKQHGMLEFFMSIVPNSIVGAFANGEMLPIIFFSVLLAISLAKLGPRTAPFVDMLDMFLQGMFGVVRIVMYVAPIGAFGGMAFTIAKYGIGTLASFGELMLCLYLTSIFFVVVVLGFVMRLCGLSLWKFLRYIKDEILITLGTASTEAVLPQMLIKMEKMGCSRPVVGMVLPTGYTFNADGTAIYLTMAALFIAQAMNIHLSIWDQLLVLAVLLLTSKGSAGVAGAGFVALAATLASMHKIPVEGLVLLLGVDRFLNEARAVTNLIGNGVATVVVARWEGQLDMDRARVVLNRENIDEIEDLRPAGHPAAEPASASEAPVGSNAH